MPSLHQRAKDVFLEALALPSAEREPFVAAACGTDAALRAEVESLLAFHDNDAAPEPDRLDEPSAPFGSGDIVAGRYRMIARLGRGGMGDVWRADDLVLQTPVALKLIHSTGPDARERILNEVRLARQITHPNVCRVFDVGQDGGTVFYSMELVRGEDLAALLRRVGRLPSEKVVEIARQLCAGLAAAHAQGVLHRDLKPANVLIDDNGSIRITDFGIAIPRTEVHAHLQTGTPLYRAPEQRMPGTPLSERTDVYAVGLVLYELLVGKHPFALGATVAQRPSTVAPNVDLRLERVVMQALSADPKARPASAIELAAGLPDISSTTTRRSDIQPGILQARRSVPWWVGAAGLAVLVGVLSVAASYMFPRNGPGLTGQDTIVLADFENGTGEPVFDGALKVALAVALEQSPFLHVFPDERARETLQLMRRSPDERITRAVAREIAQREQLKALLAGSIASLGRNYVLTLEAINAATGDVMAREQSEAASQEQVLTALGTAASALRTKLGESLASVQKFDVSLPRATTSSLDALHSYALALPDGRQVPRLEAIPHLKRAIELDPMFAMAHALLSGVYANTGQTALAPEYARRAFDLRDRVSERERFFISWRYYRDSLQDFEKALELTRSWTATYPREVTAFNSLGAALIRLGQFENSLAPLREAVRLDSRFTPAYSNLAASLLALGRYADARATLREAADRQLDFAGARRLSYLVAFVEGDAATMARELEASIGIGETNAAFGWQAHASAFAGQALTAHEQFRRGAQMSLQGGFSEVAAQLGIEDAETHAIVGQCVEARDELASGIELSRDNSTLEHASRVLALCGAADEAMALANEVGRRFPEATLTNRVSRPVAAAILAVQRGDASRALELLEPVRPLDFAPSAEFWPTYLRGRAYLLRRDGAAAAAEFQAIVDRRGVVPTSMLYALAYVGLARAATLSNDTLAANAAYDRFLALWDGADTTLQPMREVMAERAQLAARGDLGDPQPAADR